MTRRVHIRALLPDKELGERQFRIIAGLLPTGFTLGECRGLPWYDVKLERYYPPGSLTGLTGQSNTGEDVRHGELPANCIRSDIVPLNVDAPPGADPDAKFDKKAYQRELMRKRREAKKA